MKGQRKHAETKPVECGIAGNNLCRRDAGGEEKKSAPGSEKVNNPCAAVNRSPWGPSAKE